jgi:sigma-B regulation protein RsbU (phosphoserine phosphatase)
MDTDVAGVRSADVHTRLRDAFLPKGTRILMAEDDPLSARMLEAALSKFGYEVVVARDGIEAWDHFDREPFRMIVSDWMMPGMDGLRLCQKVRERGHTAYTYFILLTARDTSSDNYEQAGAAGVDDFLTKPLDREAIRIRLRVAERILKYTAEIRQLREMIPICVYCRKVRDEHDCWDQVETYIQKQTGSRFTHAACPGCYETEVERLSVSPNDL